MSVGGGKAILKGAGNSQERQDAVHGVPSQAGLLAPMHTCSPPMIAGTLGAVGNNQLGVSGVSWKVHIIGCKFLDAEGNGATSLAVKCQRWCRCGRLRGGTAHGTCVQHGVVRSKLPCMTWLGLQVWQNAHADDSRQKAKTLCALLPSLAADRDQGAHMTTNSWGYQLPITAKDIKPVLEELKVNQVTPFSHAKRCCVHAPTTLLLLAPIA
jgi:hypothetical protein